MANNGPIVNQHFQQHNNQFHCKECGLFFDSSKSLDVHLQYHKENLLTKWASQATQNNPASGAGGDEANNNNTKSGINIKREFNTSHANTIAAAADSSDANMKSNNKSPDAYTSRATPETSASFGHPSTPQSFHSAASPYQNTDATNTFSPGFHAYHKGDRASPATHYSGFNHQQASFDGQYFSMEPPSYQDYGNKPTFRYHPYNTGGHHAQVSSSSRSPSYAGAQTTPSPSPKQCDKCGFVCDSAAQLVEHLQMAHPPTPFQQQQQQLHHQQQQFQFPGPGANDGSGPPEIKQENEPQAEILDLDSHKVHVYQTPEEQEEAMKRQNAELAAMNGAGGVHNPHSVSAMLSSWPNNSSQQKQFAGVPQNNQEQRIYANGPDQAKMFGNGMHEEKMFSNAHEQKLFQPHQMHGAEFLTGNVSTTTHDVNGQIGMSNMNVPQQQQVPQPYRPFEHVPPQPNPPVISSTQVPNSIPPANLPTPVVTKGANWKSNEARRPKTYNCSACNKWFTSSGHLKRHYNTTLHKNAVKSSGQPDPATLPISAHHHPNRDPNHQSKHQDGNSQSPSPLQVSAPPDDRDDNGMVPPYERAQHPGLLQQPPSGPYDRHPPNIGGPPQAPGLHSPLSQNPSLSNSLTNLSSTSPPNGEAGPSANNIDHSRGLLSISTPNTPHRVTPLSPMVPMSPASNQLPPFNLLNQQSHMMGMPSPTASGQVFHTMPQITGNYPNGSSPHVTQTMVVTNSQPPALISLTSTGELEQSFHMSGHHGPLPSFSQFQSVLLAGYTPVISNVGGPGPVTDSHLAYPTFTQYVGPVESDYITGDMHSPHEAEAPLSYGAVHDHIIYRTNSLEPADYQMTVLQPIASEYIKCEVEDPYSPPNHNNNDSDNGETENVSSISIKEKELETSSPLITSTGSPMSTKVQPPTSIHKCIDCDKVFNKACYLTQHNKTFHCGDKPFKCNRCGKRFSDEQSYQEHSSKHAGEKPHKCELCPKQFNHKTDLRRHMCLHTGQKPYSCETCGKGFIRKDHMLKHCETHLRKSVRNSLAAQNTPAQTILGFP